MQKRHARWIAALAVAGTTAIVGTAAAEATTSVKTPQQVSPATCAALAADLASTLTNAAKGLLATPPDLSAATNLVAEANKLQNAIKSLACTGVTVPSVPAVPSLPASPSVPSVPGVPSAPGLPSLPGLPSAPALPSLPAVPSLPSLPGGVVPSLPPLPGVGGALPSL